MIVRFEFVELVDFLEHLKGPSHFFVRNLCFFAVHFNYFLILQNFLFEIRVFANIVLFIIQALIVLQLILLALIRLDHDFEFLLHLIGEVVPQTVLLASDNIVVAFTDMNGISIAKIVVTLSFIMNTGQVGRGLVLLATHEPASGLGEG